MPADVPLKKDMSYWEILKATINEWSQDRASRLAAAVAYYAIFSVGPLLMIAIAIVGLIYGKEAASDQIRPQIAQYLGDKSAGFVQELVKKAAYSPSFSFAGIASIILILYAATNFFVALQDALNTIFDVEIKPDRGIKGIVADRTLSFIMVAVLAAFVVASVVLSSIVAAMTSGILLTIVNFIVSALLFTAIFAALFKYLPDIQIDWKDTLFGAALTSVLFTLARIGLSYYLGRSSTTGPFGAAGSLVVIMLFIYYSTQILFFGAEFTQVWAQRNGEKIKPAENAVSLDPSVTSSEEGVSPPPDASGATGSRTHYDATQRARARRGTTGDGRPQWGGDRRTDVRSTPGNGGRNVADGPTIGELSPHYPSHQFHPPLPMRRPALQLASAAALFAIPVTWLMLRRK